MKKSTLVLLTSLLLPLAVMAQLSVDLNVTPPTCAYYTNGNIQATPNGGTAPYTYAWSNGQGGSAIYGLGEGTYSVTVTDANGETASASATVTAPVPLEVEITPPTGNICDGNIGTFEAVVTGGNGPFTYNWSNGANTSSITDPNPGYYFVSVTDANGCKTNGGLQIAEALTVSVHVENVVCAALCDGSVEAIINGGIAPYSFLWSNGATTQVAGPLPEGTYTVTVTDGNGCTSVASGTILAPPAIVLGLTVQDPCSGNGSATVSATGGVPPYTYDWSNGSTSTTATGLTPGTWFVTVTDANDCKQDTSVTISDGMVTAITNVVNPDCDNLASGSATATVTSGVGPFGFLWSDGQTTQTATGLIPGEYTVTVTDDAGCTGTASAEIVAVSGIELSLVATPAGCNAAATGTATANVTLGGTPDFEYEWSDGQTTQTASNLAPGTYSVTVTDANDCTATADVEVDETPSNLVLGISPQAACEGSNAGSAIVNVTSGGTPDFEYFWSDGQVTQTATNLVPGSYSVTVTDADGCTATASAQVNEVPNDLEIDASSTPTGCGILATGSATATVTAGGIPDFEFLWNTGAATPNISDLAAGTYSVTVTDAVGCSATANVDVDDTPSDIALSVSPQAACEGSNAGSATVNVTSGGTPNFEYLWSDGQVTQTATDLAPGNYSVTVTDADGCTSTSSTQVEEILNDLDISTVATPTGCGNSAIGMAEVEVIAGGTPDFEFLWNDGQTTQSIVDLPSGTYTVTVTDANGCTDIDEVEVEPAVSLTILVQSENASCHNTADGSAEVVLVSNNAVPPLDYLWSNDETTEAIQNQLPGNYSVTVTDDNQCTGTVPVTIGADATISTDFSWEIDGCPGDTTMVGFTSQIDFTPVTNPIMSWSWTFSDGQSADEANPIMIFTDTSITATLVVENASGCMDSLTQEVSLQSNFTVTFPNDASACATDTLDLEVIFNPNDDLSFDWSTSSPSISILGNGQPNVQVVASDTGNFLVTVLVTNLADSCTVQESVTVSFSSDSVPFDPSLVTTTQCDSTTLDFTNENPQANGYTWFFDHPNDPTATATGSDPSYTYSEPGMYTVLLIPESDCNIDTFILEVIVEEPPLADFTVESTGCSDTDTLTFTDVSTVPSTITSWDWEFSNGSTSTTNTVDLIFDSTQTVVATLTIEFESGCMATVTDSVLARVFPPFSFQDTVFACQPELMVELNPLGNDDFDHAWSPGTGLDPNETFYNPTATVTGLTTYSVVISNEFSGENCTVEREVTVLIPDAIGLTSPDDVEDCVPGTATLTADSGVSPIDFVWSNFPDFSDTLSQGPTIDVDVTDPASTFYVQAVDEFGCAETGEVTVGYYPVAVQVPDIVDDCLGDTPEIEVTGPGSDDQIEWMPEDPNQTTLNDTTDYVVTVTNPFGCTATDTVTVNVIDVNRLIDVTPVLDTILAGESTQLNVIANFDFNCDWSNSETLDDNLDCAPFASPLEETTYTVEVTNDIGCRGSGTATVCVVNNLCDEPMIYVPTAFTPNGDGLNDVLYVRGYNIERVLVFAIYDRWGQKVFESRSKDEGWDGTYDGRIMTGDSFAYYLKVECVSGEEFFKKGNVTVIR